MKKIIYFIQYIPVLAAISLLSILPVDAASALGGWIGRTVGLRLGGINRRALKNLQFSLPGRTESDYQKIISGMWDNLGRVTGEYPHLESIAANRIDIENGDILTKALSDGGPVILIGAHLGNWELMGALLMKMTGRELDLTYRALNNPFADGLLKKRRTLNGRLRAYAKSKEGGRQMIRALRENRIVGVLIDQKYNEGIAVPFFGRNAMTNPVFAQMGQMFNAPVIPVQGIRHGRSAKFTARFHQPLTLRDTDGNNLPLADILKDANMLLERWINENPEQWMWVHSRWPGSEKNQA